MKRRVLSFLAGAAAALALTALTATALAASGQVQFNFAGVALNGETKIAAGSGTTVADVNKLLKQFEMMQKMMKQLKKSPKGFARKLGGMMGNPNAFRGLK